MLEDNDVNDRTVVFVVINRLIFRFFINFSDERKKDQIRRWKISYALREVCLPKLLCEMAARPWVRLTDKEKDLLNLIK